MDQPELSSRNVHPETPESPTESNSSEVSVKNIPRVGIEILLGIGLESSSEDEYEEPSSQEENVNNDVDNNDGPVNEEPPVYYGFEEVFFGDSNFILFSRQNVKLLRGWWAFVSFLIPEPHIPERSKLVLPAISGVNWQRAVLSGSGEVIMEQLSSAITGFCRTSPCEMG